MEVHKIYKFTCQAFAIINIDAEQDSNERREKIAICNVNENSSLIYNVIAGEFQVRAQVIDSLYSQVF